MNQFKIGSVYRNGYGRVVKVAWCYDPRIDGNRPGSVVVDNPGDMPQTFHPDLSTGRCELGASKYSLIPGELEFRDGQWLPISEQPRSPYFAQAMEEEPAYDDEDAILLPPCESEMACAVDLAMIARDGPAIARPVPPPVAQVSPILPSIEGLTRWAGFDHRLGARVSHGS